jgi:hypothetical protein
MKIGAFLGLVAAALIGAAITHDNITGPVLLLYPAGLILGLVIARLTIRSQVGGYDSAPTPEDYYRASREEQ